MSDFVIGVGKKSEGTIAFYHALHKEYIKRVSADKESFEFVVSQHFRMSGVYWGLTAMSLLVTDISTEIDTAPIVDWVMKCQHDNGGYSSIDSKRGMDNVI